LAQYISWKYGSYDGTAEYRRFKIGGVLMFFQQFRIWGIDISWTLVYLGANFIDYEYRIKRDEIWEYACDLAKDISNNPLLSRLLIADETEEFYSIVRKLSESEKINLEFENRKWIVYVLYQAVYALPKNPSFEDMFTLSDLWGYLGRPKHYPWNPAKNDYVKVSDYDNMINIHKEWIDVELDALKGG
jgi:hypothetical protein